MRKPSGATSNTPAVLVLCPEAPYPLVGGGQMRTASLLEYLSRRAQLDVITFQEAPHHPPAAAFPPHLARRMHALTLPYHSKQFPSRAVRNALRLLKGIPPLNDRFRGFEASLARWLGDSFYDYALIEHFWCVEYAPLLERHARTTILDLHNIESSLYQTAARAERLPLSLFLNMIAVINRRWERRWLPRFPVLLTPSENDAARAACLAPHARVVVFPNAIPLQPVPEVAPTHSLAFSGNFEYPPNLQAIRYFYTTIWPELARRWPRLRWRLIGRNAAAAARLTAADPRIEIVSSFANPLTELGRAEVVIIPLLSGSGTRVKIIEAWAAQRPVVSTTLGAEGLPARPDENILLADTPSSFCAAVSRLLASPEEHTRIARAGRLTYEQFLCWDAAWKTLENSGVFAF